MIVFLFKKENDFVVRIRNLFKFGRLGLGFMALVGGIFCEGGSLIFIVKEAS
jgi:hypothetical protein